jgi:hypothetical protein
MILIGITGVIMLAAVMVSNYLDLIDMRHKQEHAS